MQTRRNTRLNTLTPGKVLAGASIFVALAFSPTAKAAEDLPLTPQAPDQIAPPNQAKGPFDDIQMGQYGDWQFPEGKEKTWGTAPLPADKIKDFTQGAIGGSFLLLSTRNLNDKDLGKAVWQGIATDAFLNVTIAGGADKSTCLQVKGTDGRIIGRLSGDGTLNFKRKCIALGEGLIGKSVTLEVLDSSASSSIAISNMSFGDRPDTSEQEKIEKIVKEYRQKINTPGLWVAVALDGEIVAAEATGYKRASTQAPAELTDQLRIGSISKPVAGTLIGLLVDKGVISYNSKVRDVFPELIGVCNPISLESTLGQLITHKSGLAYEADRGTLPNLGESATEFRKRLTIEMLNCPKNSEPGSEERYTSGIIIACAMVEKVSNMSYEDLLQRYMVGTLGLRSLHWGTNSPNAAWGHNSLGLEKLGDAGWMRPSHAGGGYELSILDLSKFGSIHSEGHNLGFAGFTPECFQRMHKHIDTIKNDGCTLSGFYGQPEYSIMSSGATGLGELAFLEVFPNKRMAIAFYKNSDNKDHSDFGMMEEEIRKAVGR